MSDGRISLDSMARLNDAAFDGASWPAAMNQLALDFDVQAVCLHVGDWPRVMRVASRGAFVARHSKAARRELRFALACWQQRCGTFPSSGSVHSISELTGQRQAEAPVSCGRSRHAPGQALHGVLESDPVARAVISFYRIRESVPFSVQERGFIQAALPHIRRSVTQHRETALLRRRAALLETVLDRANKGAIVVDVHSRIIYANASARDTLESGSVLRDDDGRLAAASGAGTARLRSSARDLAAHAATSATCRMETIRMHGTEAHDPIEILMESGSSRSIIGTSATAPVLVFVNDPQVIDRSLTELFRGMFDLTPTEARLCGALARGLSLNDAATEFGCTISTVRSHLQRLFSKTGTHRQAELLRRLGTIAALH